jgi:hypothetical protein
MNENENMDEFGHCARTDCAGVLIEDWADAIGFMEQEREVHVYLYSCGHERVE